MIAIQTLAATETAPANAERTTLNRKCPCLTCGLPSDCTLPAGFRKASLPESKKKVPNEAASKPNATQVIAVTCSCLLAKVTTSKTSTAAVATLQRTANTQESHNTGERKEKSEPVPSAMFKCTMLIFRDATSDNRQRMFLC